MHSAHDSIQKLSTPGWLLVLGLGCGAFFTAYGLLWNDDNDTLATNSVAMVNHRSISRDSWLRAVAAIASERSVPLNAADKRHILDRLIDEELLVQHGIKLGLPEQDGRIRSQLVSEVMMIARNSTGSDPDEALLISFYENNKHLFTTSAQMRVAAWRLDARGTRMEYLPGIPNALLLPNKLQNYLGPKLTAIAVDLPVDTDSKPFQVGNDRVVLKVIERKPSTTPAFNEIRELVRAEAIRHADELAVVDLLQQLRRDNKVVVAKAPP